MLGRRTAVAVLALVPWLLLGQDEWILERPAPAIALRPPVQERAGELDCGSCHAAETEEWARTAHAIAWVDEVYVEALAARKRPELCHGCHVPQPILAGDPRKAPRPRDPASEPLHFGVSCRSCHEGPDGAMLGPTGAATDAHATARSDYMVAPGSNALCSACHDTNIGPVVGIAKDFEKAGLEARGKNCVGCHFAALPPDETGRVRRSHELQTPRDPAFLARAFEPVARARGGGAVVSIANRAGHRVPGLRGREIRFRAEARDASGRVLASAEEVLTVRSYLPVGESLELRLDASGAEIRLVGEHLDPRVEEPVTFLEATLAPEGR